jgi:hypothetical protein
MGGFGDVTNKVKDSTQQVKEKAKKAERGIKGGASQARKTMDQTMGGLKPKK